MHKDNSLSYRSDCVSPRLSEIPLLLADSTHVLKAFKDLKQKKKQHKIKIFITYIKAAKHKKLECMLETRVL